MEEVKSDQKFTKVPTSEEDEEQGKYAVYLINGLMLLFYKVAWIPLRILAIYLFYWGLWFYYNLMREKSEDYSMGFKKVVCVFMMIVIGNSAFLYLIITYKWNPGHIDTPRFKELEKRFSKNHISKLSPDLKKILSYSHYTEKDWKNISDDGENGKKINECEYCQNCKPITMSHCSKWDQCFYKLDHHCPWTNSCIAAHNLHYFISMLCYSSISLVFNVVFVYWYNSSQLYEAHITNSRIMFAISFFLMNVVVGYTIAELFTNGNGRTFLEVIKMLIMGPQKPKYNLETSWRENMYVVYGTFNLFIAIPFPYLFGPPITGLEFCMIPQNKEPEDFVFALYLRFASLWRTVD